MAFIISPNMQLVIPGVGTEAGPTYATDVNNSLTIIDSHNHSPGSGVQITPSGLNINSTLEMNINILNNIGSLGFAFVSTPTANRSLYVASSDLYFVDGTGNNIRVTSGGAVNATSSGISSGTASASFSVGTLVVTSNTSIPGNIQAGSLVMGLPSATTHFLTLSPPSTVLSTDYTLTLPSLPAQTNVMTLDSSGNMSSTTWNAVAENRTRSIGQTAGLGGIATSPSSGNFVTGSATLVLVTSLRVTLTTSGRPVQIMLKPLSNFSTSTPSGISSSTAGTGLINIKRDGTSISTSTIGPNTIPPALADIDAVTSGTYVYEVYAALAILAYVQLVAYEL